MLIGGDIDKDKLEGFWFCKTDDENDVTNSKIGDRQVVLDVDNFSCLKLVHLKPEDKVYAGFVAQSQIEP